MYEQSTDSVDGIRPRWIAWICRLNMKQPPTSSVGFRTFCAKPAKGRSREDTQRPSCWNRCWSGWTRAGGDICAPVPVAQLRSGYYNSLNRYTELFVHDGSFVKLRQIILTYQIPPAVLKKLGIQSASVAFVSRNLFTLYKKTVNFDPEQSLTNGAAQGIESIGLPRTRSYGVNLMLKF